MNAIPRRPPPTGSGPSINLTPEQFHQLMLAALKDSPRAREILRQSLLPSFPIQGAACAGPSAADITSGNFGGNCSDSGNYNFAGGGKVGIGTTSPTQALTVSGGAIIGPHNINNESQLKLLGYSGSYNAGLQFGDGHNTNNIGQLKFHVGQGDFFYQYSSDGSSYSTFLTIKVSGNVGIGTTGPLSKLDVAGGVAVGSYAGANAAPSNGLIVSGNVGIGTSSPAYKLDVSGDQRATGNVIVSGASASVIIGGAATKQSSDHGGPELLSFQHSAFNHVAFACFVGSESNFRFGSSLHGFMEWGPGSGDQDVAFFRNWAGGLAVQSFNNTSSDHAFAVQKPTNDGSVGADLFRVDTSANPALILGKLGVNLSSPNFVLHTSGDAVALGAPNAAPTDANLNASNISFWLGQTNNNLKVRVKYSNGTLKTATIALS
jgi:hypothetical protein